MAQDSNTDNGQLRGARSVELRVAAKLENLAMLRTLVAAVGTFEDLDFDSVSDLRLAVDEACTRLIRSAVVRFARTGCSLLITRSYEVALTAHPPAASHVNRTPTPGSVTSSEHRVVPCSASRASTTAAGRRCRVGALFGPRRSRVPPAEVPLPTSGRGITGSRDRMKLIDYSEL